MADNKFKVGQYWWTRDRQTLVLITRIEPAYLCPIFGKLVYTNSKKNVEMPRTQRYFEDGNYQINYADTRDLKVLETNLHTILKLALKEDIED